MTLIDLQTIPPKQRGFTSENIRDIAHDCIRIGDEDQARVVFAIADALRDGNLLIADSEQPTAQDYEKILADHRKLVRDLDVLLNGESGAARQASLCDIVSQVARMKVLKPQRPYGSASKTAENLHAATEQPHALSGDTLAASLDEDDAFTDAISNALSRTANPETLCTTCARADVDCPIYPQQTTRRVEHRASAPTLEKPASVGGLRFQKGLPVSYVIEAAYRRYEHEESAEGKAQRKANSDALFNRIQQAREATAQNEQHDEPGPIIRQFGYQPLFNAISSATQWREGRTIEISVLAFQSALLAAVPPAAAPDKVIKLGLFGKAFDTPQTCRAYTYQHQPDNLDASKLGRAAASSSPDGDSIDHGLSLLQQLQEEGFGVFELGNQQKGGA